MRLALLPLALLALPAPLLAAPRTPPSLSDPAIMREQAADAYVFLYPLVLQELTRRLAVIAPPPLGAPVNQWAHRPSFPDDKATAIVRPNADTLYSSLWYDVTDGPLVIELPDSTGRYFLLQMMDAWTETWAAPGSRTTGSNKQRIAIVGPDWQGEPPDGVPTWASPTNQGWLLGRTQTNGPADYPAVRAFQAGIKVISAPDKPAPVARPTALAPPFELIDTLSPQQFFTVAADVMTRNRWHYVDWSMMDQLDGLGLEPGFPFDWTKLTPAQRTALDAAPAGARPRIRGGLDTVSQRRNGWRTTLGAIGSYGANYLQRAATAYFGFGANPPEDAIYPSAYADSEGRPLDSAHRYVIRFAANQLPPVRAFWSLTLYNGRQLFAANPINRFALGDRDPLHTNADGSLELYVQRDDPGGAKTANWLPAPASGPFSLTLRLYWPAKDALDGRWSPPPVVRVD